MFGSIYLDTSPSVSVRPTCRLCPSTAQFTQHSHGPDLLVDSNMASSSNIPMNSFLLANDILEVSSQDEIYKFDSDANKAINRQAPWSSEYDRFHYCTRLQDISMAN